MDPQIAEMNGSEVIALVIKNGPDSVKKNIAKAFPLAIWQLPKEVRVLMVSRLGGVRLWQKLVFLVSWLFFRRLDRMSGKDMLERLVIRGNQETMFVVANLFGRQLEALSSSASKRMLKVCFVAPYLPEEIDEREGTNLFLAYQACCGAKIVLLE